MEKIVKVMYEGKEVEFKLATLSYEQEAECGQAATANMRLVNGQMMGQPDSGAYLLKKVSKVVIGPAQYAGENAKKLDAKLVEFLLKEHEGLSSFSPL